MRNIITAIITIIFMNCGEENSTGSDNTAAPDVDPALIGTWFSTAPKGWSRDTAYISQTRIKVPGLSVQGLSFSCRDGKISDWEGKVVLEYAYNNDTLYLESLVFKEPDGQVDKVTADGFTKISGTVPNGY